MPRRLLSVVATLSLFVVQAGIGGRCWGGPFTAGDLVVVRAGDGIASFSGGGTVPVFLDEFNPITGSLVQSVPLPTTVSGSNRALTLVGNGPSEGYLTPSTDGRYLTLAGYDAGVGVLAQSMSPTGLGGSVDRVVARVDSNGTIVTSTVLTNAYGAGSIRSAATDDGSRYWTSGTSGSAGANANTGGVYVIAQGATTGTRLSSDSNNTRNIAIFNNQLYVSSGPGTGAAVSTVGSGLPTTGNQSIAPFVTTGLSGNGGGSPYSFVVFDLNGDGVPDRVYVADDRVNGSGGLQKWTSTNGTDWTLSMTFSPNTTTGLRGLTGQLVNGNPVLYATTTVSGGPIGGSENQLVSFTDDGTNTSFTSLATAGSLMAYRGVAFAPAVPEPGTLALAGLGGLALAFLVIRRRGHESNVVERHTW
jgi:hypothetical protein